MEIWRDIEGYEGYYQVSNLGRVKRLLTRVNSNKGGRTVCEKILCQCSNRGYMVVHVCMFNKRRKLKVHRLVAEAFLPNIGIHRTYFFKYLQRHGYTYSKI